MALFSSLSLVMSLIVTISLFRLTMIAIIDRSNSPSSHLIRVLLARDVFDERARRLHLQIAQSTVCRLLLEKDGQSFGLKGFEIRIGVPSSVSEMQFANIYSTSSFR